MEPFLSEKGIAAVVEGRNLDTDQIIPGRFLKADRRQGYGGFLFHDLRFQANGAVLTDFILNREPFDQSTILVTDENFGCGSSREGAVYALQDFGIRALIGPSFGDIFRNNCLKNGIVPVQMDKAELASLRQNLSREPGARIEVDLVSERVVFPDGSVHALEIDPFWRTCLMEGVDDLELSMRYSRQIRDFIDDYQRSCPWAV